MLNEQIISSHIQPANLQDAVQKALDLAHEQDYPYVVVTSEDKLLGVIATRQLEEAGSDLTLADIAYRIQPLQVKGREHIFRAAAIFAAQPALPSIPVADAEGHYEGMVERNEVIRQAGILQGLHDTGALIVLDIDPRQLAVGEISKLVETNDAQITQLNTAVNEQGRMTVTLRINTPEVSDIVATLQRYDYSVVYFEGEERYQNQLRQNYELLMNFLEM